MTAINKTYDLLNDVWGAMNGLKLHFHQPANRDRVDVQNLLYNEWEGRYCISNISLFTPDGKVSLSFVNCPGTTHDSTIGNWSNIYPNCRASTIELEEKLQLILCLQLKNQKV